MEINTDPRLTSAMSHSGNEHSLKKQWDAQFWQQQNMHAVQQGSAKSSQSLANQSAVPSIQLGDTAQVSNRVQVEAPQARMQEAQSSSIWKSDTAMLVIGNQKQSTLTHGLAPSQVHRHENNSLRYAESQNVKLAVHTQEETKSGLIQKHGSDVKLWTSKRSEQKGWKQTLIKGFAFFGMNLVKVVVRGREY